MRFYKEPGLGINSFMALIGVGEIFATPEVFSGFEEIEVKDYEIWNVIIHKTNQSSEIVSQLYIPGLTKSGLLGTEEMRHVVCQKCGSSKYYPHKRGVMKFKRNVNKPGSDFVKQMNGLVLAILHFKKYWSQNGVTQLLIDKGWKGIRFQSR